MMAIHPGDRIPSLTLKHLTADGIADLSTDDVFGGKKVVLFGVPGAFTPTCSNKHLPGFLENADALRAKGVDEIVCMAVNDPFVMKIWGEQSGAGEKVMMLPDGNGELTQAMGLDMDGTGAGLGHRCKRFAMVVDNGTVQKLAVDDKGLSETSAESILSEL
jgi:peroxiredoxin